MAKPVILGINLDDIEWQPAEEVYGGKDVGLDVPSGMLVKVLWKDEETGASATLLKAPPGWTTPHPEFHSCTQEGFMIEGREIKGGKLGQLYRNGTYTGITYELWRSMDAVGDERSWEMWGTPNCGKGEPSQTGHVGHGVSGARFRNVRVGVLS